MNGPITNIGTASMSHNGPICATCGVGYIGAHQCEPAAIAQRIRYLLDILEQTGRTTPAGQPPLPDRTRTCPCRPENGGSGVCGCILGGLQVTC